MWKNTLQPPNLAQHGGLSDRCKNLLVGCLKEEDSKSEHEGFGRVGFVEYLRGVIASTSFRWCHQQCRLMMRLWRFHNFMTIGFMFAPSSKQFFYSLYIFIVLIFLVTFVVYFQVLVGFGWLWPFEVFWIFLYSLVGCLLAFIARVCCFISKMVCRITLLILGGWIIGVEMVTLIVFVLITLSNQGLC